MAAGIVNVRRDVDDKFYRYRCMVSVLLTLLLELTESAAVCPFF